MRAIEFSKRSRHSEAAEAATKLRELDSATNGQLYNAACVFARFAASIQATEEQELTAEQVQRRDKWIDEALATLRKSVEAGWLDFDHIRADPDLAVLRERPEFNAIIQGTDESETGEERSSTEPLAPPLPCRS